MRFRGKGFRGIEKILPFRYPVVTLWFLIVEQAAGVHERKKTDMSPTTPSSFGGPERRRHPRIETSNVVTYVCVDEDGNEIAEGYGTTRDLSLGGILLETNQPVESPYILLLDIDLQENMLEVRGKVVHSTEMAPGVFQNGISFVDTEERQREIVRSFVKTHARHKVRAGKQEGPQPKA